MEIQFTQSRPQSARLVAQVTDKGKVPVGLDKAMTEGMEAARFPGRSLTGSSIATVRFSAWRSPVRATPRMMRGLPISKRPAPR